MAATKIPGIIDKGEGGPLIMLFSPRRRIRDILTVGLVQCNYSLIQADSSFLAMIKINQFLPDYVILDITTDNTKDLLLLARLRKSARTKLIPILVIIPPSLRKAIEKTHADETSDGVVDDIGLVRVLEYPFNFSDVLSKVKEGLFDKERVLTEGSNSKPFAAPEQGNGLTEKRLFDPDIPVEKKLAEIENILHKQWTFPFTVVKALDIIESNASCCNELAQCIKGDLAASSAILKVANTVYYAKRGGARVTDIREAVVRLGFRETRNLLSCLAVIDLSPELYRSYGFSRRDFWLHSLATALIAEKICAECGYRRPEMAFLAGLVHDLGKIPLDNNCKGIFRLILEEASINMHAFYEVEEEKMRFSHATLGHYLTTTWNFPPLISMAILNHHSPEKIVQSGAPMERIVAESVFVANILAKAMSLGHSCDQIIRDIPVEMLRELELLNGVNERFFSAIFRNLSTFCHFLNIPARDLLLATTDPNATSVDIVVVYDKRVLFHPVVVALRNNGFVVKSTHHFSPELQKQTRIVISISDKGTPLDLMLYDDELQEEPGKGVLKIFLLDVIPEQSDKQELLDRNIIFLDRRRLDVRALLHTIDQFLQQVVVPKSLETVDDHCDEGIIAPAIDKKEST